MGFIQSFFRAYVEMLERAGFIEHVLIVVLFGISSTVVGGLLFAAVVFLIFGLCNWWSGAGADAAVDLAAAAEGQVAAEEQAVAEGQAAPPVAEVAALPVGGEPAARAVRRRRAARDSASGEPGSSSSNTTEVERE